MVGFTCGEVCVWAFEKTMASFKQMSNMVEQSMGNGGLAKSDAVLLQSTA